MEVKYIGLKILKSSLMDGWIDGGDKRTGPLKEMQDQVGGVIFFQTFFSPILKMIPFRLLLAISKPFKLQQRDCNRVVDLLAKINLLFLFFL